MNWGFIGYGRIAVKFMESLQAVEGEIPYALASKSNSEALKQQYPNVKVYSSYEDLLSDSEVDIVYVSTTNNLHKQNTIDALKAGKHVLCEKPLGLTVKEVEEMVATAREENRFLMEALWSRFLPGYQKAKQAITSGEIGEVKLIKSEFAFTDVSHKDRLYNPALAGGSNYDVNIYNLALVHDIIGNTIPEMVIQAKKSETGTDLCCSSLLKFENGQMAQLFSSIEMTCDNAAFIYGTNGWLRMEHFWMSERFEVYTWEGVRKVEAPYTSNGYYHEIIEVAKSIRSGQIEHPLMTHSHSIELARLVEQTEKLIRDI